MSNIKRFFIDNNLKTTNENRNFTISINSSKIFDIIINISKIVWCKIRCKLLQIGLKKTILNGS